MRTFVIAGLSVALVALVACAACSSSGSSSNAGSDGGGGGGGDDSGGPPPPGSFSITFGPLAAPATEEHTKCIVKRLGNPDKMHVGSVHNVLSLGSHHLIVYRTNDTAEQTTPFDCKPFTDTLDPTKGSTLMISQKRDDTLQLPDGVGYTLDANQMVRLEMHYINAGSSEIKVQATSTFVPIADAAFKFEADFLFIGTPDINIPPLSKATVGPMFLKLPAAYDGVNFFAMTGHEHQYGTNVTVHAATSASDPGTPVYDVPGWLWSEPKTVVASPPFQIATGGGFSFSCSWNNTSNAAVGFGESANAEMCFFWAYYYPSQGGARVCIHTNKVAGGLDGCCPGSSPVCNFLKP